MDVINAKSNTYPFVEVVIYSEILRTNCRMNQSSSHLATKTRQPHTGGTAVRRGNKAYDDQTTIRPSGSPQLRSEANRRRTSQYVQDVSQISEPIIVRQTEHVTYAVRGKQDNNDK